MTMHRLRSMPLILLGFAVSVGLLIGSRFRKDGCRSGQTNCEIPNGDYGTEGAVRIDKMGGPIDVRNAPHGATLSTMGGDIHLANVDLFAKLKTMGGNISIEQANASIDATTLAGNITARVVGSSSDRRDIKLSSNSGTIVLAVPKDFPMDLNITLAYTNNSNEHFRIIDDVGLNQQSTDTWDNEHGTPRKYIRAEGRVGNGLNRVTISTVNGNVILQHE